MSLLIVRVRCALVVLCCRLCVVVDVLLFGVNCLLVFVFLSFAICGVLFLSCVLLIVLCLVPFGCS